MEPRYDAFISYSHSTDGALAPALERGLTRLAKPWYRRRALRVFRDDTGLAVTPELWGSIETALDESRYLVLLASPDAAASAWVNREVEHWLTVRDAHTILPVLTDGTLEWDDTTNTIDAARSTAVPPALATGLVEEPRYLDVSWARDEADLTLRNPRFRAAVAELAAPIRGVPKDELEGEDLRLHRRAVRLARAAVATLAILTVAAIVAATLAIRNADEADRRRIESESRELAARSLVLVGQRPDAALDVAVAANRVQRTPEARSALLDVLGRNPRLRGSVDLGGAAAGANVAQVAFAGDPASPVVRSERNDEGRRYRGALLGLGRQGAVRVLGRSKEPYEALRPVAGGRLVTSGSDGVMLLDGRALRRVAPGALVLVAPDGTHALVRAGDELRLVDLDTGDTAWPLPVDPSISLFATFALDGSRVALSTSDGALRILDAATGEVLGAPLPPGGQQAADLEWTSRGDLFLVVGDRRLVAPGGSLQQARELAQASIGSTAAIGVSANGERYAARGSEATAVWDLTTGALVSRRPEETHAPLGAQVDSAAVLSADGRVLLDIAPDGGATLSDATTGAVLGRDPDAGIAFPDDLGHHVVTTGSRTVLWDLDGGTVVTQREGFATAAWSADGRRLATWGSETLLSRVDGDALQTESLGAADVVLMAFTPDGGRVVADTTDGRLLEWRASGASVVPALVEPTGSTVAVASASGRVFQLQGEVVVAGADDDHGARRVRVGAEVGVLAPLPDGRSFVTERRPEGGELSLDLWDLRRGRVQSDRRGEVCGVRGLVSLTFSRDGTRMAAFDEESGVVHVCDARGHVLRDLRHRAPDGGTDALALSADGRLLVLSEQTSDGSHFELRVVDSESGDVEHHFAVAASRIDRVGLAGDRLVALAGGRVRVFDRSDGSEQSFQATRGIELAVGGDGRTIAVGRGRGDAVADGSEVLIYDMDEGSVVGVVDERTVSIDRLSLVGRGPDVVAVGQRVRGAADVVVIRTPVGTAALERRACRLGDGLDRAQWSRIVPGTPYVAACRAKT